MPLRRACPFAVVVLVACGGGGPSRPPVASVSLTPPTAAPMTSLGDTVQLTATALDASGAPIAKTNADVRNGVAKVVGHKHH